MISLYCEIFTCWAQDVETREDRNVRSYLYHFLYLALFLRSFKRTGLQKIDNWDFCRCVLNYCYHSVKFSHHIF